MLFCKVRPFALKCQLPFDFEPLHGVRMSWEGTSDWDEKEVLKGSSVLVVLKDGPSHGRLLRSVGYTDAVPAAGTWEMQVCRSSPSSGHSPIAADHTHALRRLRC